MSLNKSMHPRNPYCTPADFEALAKEFPEFRQHCYLANNGVLKVKFFDDAAVRHLTKLLLKKDFGLDVELPLGSLVPRIPQKMNYCLFIEDLLIMNNLTGNGDVVGIDIGTGASCIYSLLGVRHFGWKFVATEGDSVSAKVAHENVVRNELTEKILVAEVDPEAKTVLMDMMNKVGADQSYTFCMCNPPFFETEETDKRFTAEPSLGGEKYSNRVVFEDRPQPHSITFASSAELQVAGGEVSFVNRIIDDSIILRDQIKIYTSMLGRKRSIQPLKKRLDILGHDVKYYVTTLVQGKTTRWVLAWTFVKDFVWTTTKQPLRFWCAKPGLVRMEEMMKELDSIVRKENSETLIFECRRVTWTHLRSRRRAQAELVKNSSYDSRNAKRTKLSFADASTQTNLGVGDGRDSLSNAGNEADSWRFCTSSEEFADFQVQAYFPCPVTQNYSKSLQFRISCSPNQSNSKNEDLITIEFISGSKQNFNQLLQYFKNSLILRSS